MASINAQTQSRDFTVGKWFGLHEAPDGDIQLKLGEASEMRNWRITQDGALQRRPGSSMIKGLLRGYKLEYGEVEDIKTDSDAAMVLVMYPGVTASADGFPTVTGTAANVTSENFSTHTGWYWRRGKYFTYQMLTCMRNHETGLYYWRGRRVRCVPDTPDENYTVQGLWSGELAGRERILAACNGRLWSLWDADSLSFVKEEIGTLDTSGRVTMFQFNEDLWILNGTEYYRYDGSWFRPVEGYRPLISVSNTPDGGGDLLEEVNKLCGLRRLWFSPDGTKITYRLPETDLLSIDYVQYTADGELLPPGMYTTDRVNGTVTVGAEENFEGDGEETEFTLNYVYGVSCKVTVDGTETTEGWTYAAATHKITFTEAPADGAAIHVTANGLPAGTNSIEIGYTAAGTYRGSVCRMRFAEMYLGNTDNCVFLYGDGSNEAFYSSVDYWGQPRADYFPDLNEIAVGDSSTPVTALIRHQSKLLAFKKHSTWSISYGAITTEEGNTKYGFYLTPINRSLGCSAPGMAQMVENFPWTPHEKQIYQWTTTGYYNTNITADERSAKRVSDRIFSTLGEFNLEECYTFDDNAEKEYYICYGGRALVCNYAANAWYEYTNFDVSCMARFGGYVIFGTHGGKVECLSYRYKTIDGEPIDSYWASGSIDFDRGNKRKYSAELWVALKPESQGEVTVTVETDRKSSYSEKIVNTAFHSFSKTDFARFTFKTNRKPQPKKLKIKAKKFVYYRLVFKTTTADTAATILQTVIRVRYTGDAK